MAKYYTIEINGTQIGANFGNKTDVCLYIRANCLSGYIVFEKDNSSVQPRREGTAQILNLPPICNDITKQITLLLAQYDQIEGMTL
ncbi:MAG: hypothetical protein ACI3ZO_07250 [Candidatus Cryptobacteroides sp.]